MHVQSNQKNINEKVLIIMERAIKKIKMNNKLSFLVIILTLLLVTSATARMDSDGDGIIDDFDQCPGTNPRDGLPIILRNPEFIGCSCPQIRELMREEYCKDVYCVPGRPLEIIERSTSSRPNPCPRPRCEGTTLYKYETDTIKCLRGKELPYECEEIIIEDAEECKQKPEEPQEKQEEIPDTFDIITETYIYESRFAELLNTRRKETLKRIDEEVKQKVIIERTTEVKHRTINEQEITFLEVTLTIRPKRYYEINNLILLEVIQGDLTNRILAINDKTFYDEDLQIIVWETDSLNKEKTFTYRVTPYTELSHEVILQGEIKSNILTELVLPIILLIAIITITVIWMINKKEKNKIFKNK